MLITLIKKKHVKEIKKGTPEVMHRDIGSAKMREKKSNIINKTIH